MWTWSCAVLRSLTPAVPERNVSKIRELWMNFKKLFIFIMFGSFLARCSHLAQLLIKGEAECNCPCWCPWNR